MTNRYICIHGHFYQPPRENPWLEEVEFQESANPYHDWNERVTAECYAPNTASRILDADKKIGDIVNNYAHISFNFGPSLLSWMEKHALEDYKSILEADKESQKRFSGHGSALAQVYNHIIMPLANLRDKRTQVVWGIKDFEHRFGRRPEGMWLAETAVDIPTLEMLAEHGITFTILAPHQAGRVKKIEENKWLNVKGGKIDPQRVYLCKLPSGKSIHVFFYDGPISHELAFKDLLRDGKMFAERLTGVFPQEPDHDASPRLVHAATDGETYGHHKNFGDMALAFCLHHIESHQLAKVTIYGEYLEKFPATHEVQILEDTSWSCAHGVERWRSDCGCRIGSHPGWHQKWRQPLRYALDWLRDTAALSYEEHMKSFMEDPWQLRNHYIDVLLNRQPQNVEKFFEKYVHKEVSQPEKIQILKLLELQRNAMLMYTSCGWFFDEISGIETLQILQYAARVIQLTQETTGQNLEDRFQRILSGASSNIPEHQNGAVIYERMVKPVVTDLVRVGAHHAVASLFEDEIPEKRVYCYSVRNEFYERKEAGKQKIVIGRSRIRSDITWEEETVCFAVLHLGDHNFNSGARCFMEDGAFEAMRQEIKRAFSRSDIPELMRLINHHFGRHHYSLKDLFKEEQKRIFHEVVRSTLEDLETHFRQIYDQHYPLVQAKVELKIPLPRALMVAIEFVLNRDLMDALGREGHSVGALERIVEEVARLSLEIDKTTVGFVASRKIHEMMRQLQKTPYDLDLLEFTQIFLKALSPLQLHLDLWRAQNIYFAISKQLSKTMHGAGDQGYDGSQDRWPGLFRILGDSLRVQIR